LRSASDAALRHVNCCGFENGKTPSRSAHWLFRLRSFMSGCFVFHHHPCVEPDRTPSGSALRGRRARCRLRVQCSCGAHAESEPVGRKTRAEAGGRVADPYRSDHPQSISAGARHPGARWRSRKR
jgi:hypothetical protein